MVIAHEEAPLILQIEMSREAVGIKLRKDFADQFLVEDLLSFVQLILLVDGEIHQRRKDG